MIRPLQFRGQFALLTQQGRRSQGRYFWVRYVAHGARPLATSADDVCVGYAVSRKIGTAVVRNRIQRRCRAVVAASNRDLGLAPGLYLIGVRNPGPATIEFAEMRADLLHVLDRASTGPMSKSSS